MINVAFPENGNNSPEIATAVEFYKIIFSDNTDAAFDMITEDHVYVVHGMGEYVGREGLEKLLREMKASNIRHVEVANIFGNGDYVAAQGTVELEDKTRMTFSEIFAFRRQDEKLVIARVDSYTVMAGQE